jgi:HEAT repeat protein
MSHLPLFLAEPAKHPLFWQATVLTVLLLIGLNLLLIAVVFGGRLGRAVRRRRTAGFDESFEPVVDEIAGHPASVDRAELRRRIEALDDLERPLAATMLLERVMGASAEARAEMLDLLRDTGAVDLMLRGTRRRRPWRRVLAIRGLGWLGAPEGVSPALEHLSDRNRYVREASIRALGRIGDKRALPRLEEIYLDPERTVASGFAYEAVVAFGVDAAPVFRRGLRSDDERTRVASCYGIVHALDPDRARPLLEGMLGDSAPTVRAAASETLGRIGGDKVPTELARASRDNHPSVRLAAAGALGSYDDARALDLVLGALDDPDRNTAIRAGESLIRLGRLPGIGQQTRAAVEETNAWPVARARTLASLGAL